MSDFESEDLFRDPNDGAYEKTETRHGPPLAYVAEKLCNALESSQSLVSRLITSKAVDVEQKEALLSMACYALRMQLVAYLALNNMLALVNDEGFFERVEGYSRQEFEGWLERIKEQGSVTG